MLWDRQKQIYFEEKVFGDLGVRCLYGPWGRWIERVLSLPFFSSLMGYFFSHRLSQKKIKPFIKQYNINESWYEPHSYSNFNEFFIRRFRPGVRSFAPLPYFPSIAEGRLSVYESESSFLVKGVSFRISDLIQMGGFDRHQILVFRLCPVDYHRYHYPDAGRTVCSVHISGRFHSVNPLSIKRYPDVFTRNERRIAVLETEHGGSMAFIEVGAMGVGKIVQTYNERQQFNCGEEKGYFLFGASTVVLLIDSKKIKIDADLFEKSQAGIETLVTLGSSIGIYL